MNSSFDFSRAPLLKLTTIALAACLAAACSPEPKIDVTSSDAAQPSATAAAANVPPPTSAPPLAEGATLPANHPPLGTGGGAISGGAPGAMPSAMPGTMQIAAAAPGTGEGAAALTWKTAAGWVSEPPSNNMRRAQYKVSGPGGDGECVVFYFGPGQGGDALSNAERWASQFTDEKGQPTAGSMKTRTSTVNGIEVLFVEAAGVYQAGSMMGMGQGVAKPDWALLGAVAKGPDANWFFKFTAPKATLEANRAAFDSMIASLAKGS